MKKIIIAAVLAATTAGAFASDRILNSSDRTYSLPGVRYMHRIWLTDTTLTPTVINLPEGLQWNERRSLVEGTVDREGDYTYSVIAGTDTVPVLLTVSSDLASPTPMMGWLSWNVVLSNVSASLLKETADALHEKGLYDAGYRWLGIDDDWHCGKVRPADGIPAPDPVRFPEGMKLVGDYLHDRGLKFGIYSTAAFITCDSKFGSYQYEDIDARSYADWGVDFLKYDYCNVPELGIGDDHDPAVALELYTRMRKALDATGRPIVLYMCEWGTTRPWEWAHKAGAPMWRAMHDHRDGWYGRRLLDDPDNVHKGGQGVYEVLNHWRNFAQYTGVNRFSDADMLCAGIRGRGKASNILLADVTYNRTDSVFEKHGEIYKGMNTDEARTEFAMWCMWSSPLILSLDVRDYIAPEDLALITNPELIAINQDPMGQSAIFIHERDGFQLWAKDLANGDVAVAVVNMNDTPATYTLSPSDLDALTPGTVYTVRNLLDRVDLPDFSAPVEVSLPAHATHAVRLSQKR
ncbi:MAG: glycoside hydrolase family 27 protein [Bacteroidales bacterium]|nr:glycoside hydrolase family 27 protein [Bacteroidales bacterium]